jgi:uncharacterized protein YjcR
MALIPVHLRAEEIWSESGCNASTAQIASRLSDEGYGVISMGTIRSWKTRHQWSLPKALAINATDAATQASFEDVADALRSKRNPCLDSQSETRGSSNNSQSTSPF